MSKSKRKFKRANQPQPSSETAAAAESEQSSEAEHAASSAQAASSPTSSIVAPQQSGSVSNSNITSNSFTKSSTAKSSKNDKGKKEEQVPVDPNVPHIFKRPLWKHLIRYPAAFMLVVLNVAITGSFLERLPQHRMMDPFRELFFFGMVGFIDVFMFLPILLEVNRVETSADGLKLNALLWKTTLKWDQIRKFDQPRFLKFAMLHAPRTVYLLNKYDLKPFFELSEIITAKMARTIQERKD